MPLSQTAFTWIKSSLIALVAFVIPIRQLLLMSFVVVFADLILGVLAARKRGERIESRKLRRTLSKVIAYEIGILLAFIIETNFNFGLPLVKLVSSVIGITETKSIFENINDVTGVDFLQTILSKLQGLSKTPKGDE